MHNIRAQGRDVVLPAGRYFLEQLLRVNPLTAPIWLAGLLALFFRPPLRRYRALGWSYVVCYSFFFCLARKKLLISAYLSHTAGRGSGISGKRSWGVESRLAQTSLPCLPTGGRNLFGSDYGPSFVARLVHSLYATSAIQAAGHGTFARSGSTAPQWYADQLGWYEIVRETAVI